MPGQRFEGNPVDEGTTRRSTDAPVHLFLSLFICKMGMGRGMNQSTFNIPSSPDIPGFCVLQR